MAKANNVNSIYHAQCENMIADCDIRRSCRRGVQCLSSLREGHGAQPGKSSDPIPRRPHVLRQVHGQQAGVYGSAMLYALHKTGGLSLRENAAEPLSIAHVCATHILRFEHARLDSIQRRRAGHPRHELLPR